jgi:hypothetical protein
MRRVVGAAITALLLSAACSEPPQKEIDRAQGAIDAARAAGAELYAAESFTAALTAMKQTHAAVQQRDYRLALSHAVDANERALEAATQAADGKARARGDAEAAITHAATTMRQLDERLKTAESSRVAVADVAQPRRVRADAEKRLQEARAAVAKGDYLAALASTNGVSQRIAEEIRSVNAAIDARTARGRRGRR